MTDSNPLIKPSKGGLKKQGLLSINALRKRTSRRISLNEILYYHWVRTLKHPVTQDSYRHLDDFGKTLKSPFPRPFEETFEEFLSSKSKLKKEYIRFAPL